MGDASTAPEEDDNGGLEDWHIGLIAGGGALVVALTLVGLSYCSPGAADVSLVVARQTPAARTYPYYLARSQSHIGRGADAYNPSTPKLAKGKRTHHPYTILEGDTELEEGLMF